MPKNSQKPNFLFSFLAPRNFAKFLASLFPRNTEFHFVQISIESPHCLTFVQGIFVGKLIFVYFNAFNFLRFELCFRLRFACPLCVCLSLSLARTHTHTGMCTHTYTNTSLQLLLVCPAGGQQIALAFHVCVCVLAPLSLLLLFSLLLCCCICLLHLIMQNTASPLGASLPATPLRRLHTGIGNQQLQLHAKFIMCTKKKMPKVQRVAVDCLSGCRLPVEGVATPHNRLVLKTNRQTN